ncbi:MAG: MoaD/ThiS family protein [Rhodothermus sp.]|nr:MoaD/ThiS family protein [Rhodothermus sp.]
MAAGAASGLFIRLGRLLAEEIGQPFIVVTLPEPAVTVAQLQRLIAEQYPRLQSWMDHVLVVAEGRVLDSSEAIPAGQQVVLLPPQAGG